MSRVRCVAGPRTATRCAPRLPWQPAPAQRGAGEIESAAPAPALASSLALKVLITRLAAGGLPLAGMMLTRWQAVLLLPDGRVVRCCCGWLVWQIDKVSSQSRPLHTVHSLQDAAGAVRRLTQARRSSPVRAKA
jgi:hypothetical protein